MVQDSLEKIGERIVQLLQANDMIRLWPRDNSDGWVLHSGKWSPFYINLRAISSKPESYRILREVGRGLASLIRQRTPAVSRLVSVATAGIPVGIATTFVSKLPSCYTRKIEGLRSMADVEKSIKEYGEHSLVEGDLEDGDRILIIDDLITSGTSKLIARKLILEEARKRGINVICDDVAVIIDRQQGGGDELAQAGVRLYSLVPFKDRALRWLTNKIDTEVHLVIQEYLENDSKYQDKAYREKVRKRLVGQPHDRIRE